MWSAATALTGLGCIALGWLLVSVVPGYWLRLGIYAMAALDTYVVSTDLLQGPNSVLTVAHPGAGLPRLQAIQFGDARMGFGDLFVAALVGCLLATPAEGTKGPAGIGVSSHRQWWGAGLVGWRWLVRRRCLAWRWCFARGAERRSSRADRATRRGRS